MKNQVVSFLLALGLALSSCKIAPSRGGAVQQSLEDIAKTLKLFKTLPGGGPGGPGGGSAGTPLDTKAAVENTFYLPASAADGAVTVTWESSNPFCQIDSKAVDGFYTATITKPQFSDFFVLTPTLERKNEGKTKISSHAKRFLAKGARKGLAEIATELAIYKKESGSYTALTPGEQSNVNKTKLYLPSSAESGAVTITWLQDQTTLSTHPNQDGYYEIDIVKDASNKKVSFTPTLKQADQSDHTEQEAITITVLKKGTPEFLAENQAEVTDAISELKIVFEADPQKEFAEKKYTSSNHDPKVNIYYDRENTPPLTAQLTGDKSNYRFDPKETRLLLPTKVKNVTVQWALDKTNPTSLAQDAKLSQSTLANEPYIFQAIPELVSKLAHSKNSPFFFYLKGIFIKDSGTPHEVKEEKTYRLSYNFHIETEEESQIRVRMEEVLANLHPIKYSDDPAFNELSAEKKEEHKNDWILFNKEITRGNLEADKWKKDIWIYWTSDENEIIHIDRDFHPANTKYSLRKANRIMANLAQVISGSEPRSAPIVAHISLRKAKEPGEQPSAMPPIIKEARKEFTLQVPAYEGDPPLRTQNMRALVQAQRDLKLSKLNAEEVKYMEQVNEDLLLTTSLPGGITVDWKITRQKGTAEIIDQTDGSHNKIFRPSAPADEGDGEWNELALNATLKLGSLELDKFFFIQTQRPNNAPPE